MSERDRALAELLIRIADLSDAAETHGVVHNPPPDVLDPLLADAGKLDIRFDELPSLAELHQAVEAAAQAPQSDAR